MGTPSIWEDAGWTRHAFNNAFWGAVHTARTFLAIYRDNWKLLSFYLLLGFMWSSPALTIQFAFKDVFGIEPDQLQRYSTVIGIPWAFKVVYAFISDRYPLLGYNRKSYVIIGTAGAGVFWCFSAWAIWITEIEMFVLWMTVASFFVAIADACVNAQLMTRIKRFNQSKELQAFAQMSGSIGQLAGMLVGAFLVTHVSAHVSMFGIGVVPFVMCGFAISTEEIRSSSSASLVPAQDPIQDTDQEFGLGSGYESDESGYAHIQQAVQRKSMCTFLWGAWEFVSSRDVMYMLIFSVSLTITPDSSAAMFYFFTNELHVSRSFIALMTIIGSVGGIAGSMIYIAFMRDMPFRTLIVVVLAVMAVVRWSQLLLVTRTNLWMGISDDIFLVGDDVVSSVTIKILIIPIMETISRLCPDTLEGTSYEMVMSTFNVCSILSNFLSAAVTDAMGITSGDFSALPMLLVFNCTMNMLPFLFVRFIPDVPRKDDVRAFLIHLNYRLFVLWVDWSHRIPSASSQSVAQFWMASPGGGVLFDESATGGVDVAPLRKGAIAKADTHHMVIGYHLTNAFMRAQDPTRKPETQDV